MKTTIIHHSADFDGLFCREIACKFLPEAELIGWDFADEPIAIPPAGNVIVMDLPVDRPLGFDFSKPETVISVFGDVHAMKEFGQRLVWIDHHKTSIETHPTEIAGYRIDGVAACRLAWQWFSIAEHNAQNRTNEALQVPLPGKQDFVDRKVSEPFAVRLAGEYDVWDKRDTDAELFQHGLRSRELTPALWADLLEYPHVLNGSVGSLLEGGRVLQYAKTKENESIALNQSFIMDWEGWKFLCINAARYNSQLFKAALRPEHDGMLGFNWDGRQWRISLYNDTGKDFTPIAKKYGGGGHPGACGFQCKTLPFALG